PSLQLGSHQLLAAVDGGPAADHREVRQPRALADHGTLADDRALDHSICTYEGSGKQHRVSHDRAAIDAGACPDDRVLDPGSLGDKGGVTDERRSGHFTIDDGGADCPHTVADVRDARGGRRAADAIEEVEVRL